MTPHPMTQASEAAERMRRRKHVFSTPQILDDDDPHAERCAKCGLNLRDKIHCRSGESAETDAQYTSRIEADRDSLLAQVEELKADNARLREAVRPLAEFARLHGDDHEKIDGFSGCSCFTLADARRARAALKGGR